MALPHAQPKLAASLAAHYEHLLACEPAVDTRGHLPLFHSLAGRILEIGCDCGNSTTAFLAGKSSSVTSIDLNPFCAENFPDSPRWTFILGDSHSDDIFAKVCNQVFDVLYIDGDHSYEGAKHDLDHYSALVSAGGMILMHDVCCPDTFPGVRQAFDEFTLGRKWVCEESYGLGVIELL